MQTGIIRKIAILMAVAIVGVAIGTQVNETIHGNTQAEARESSFATVQSTWRVVELLRTDLQRAGYYETSSAPVAGLNVKMSHPSPLKVKVANDVMVFHSPNGQETIVYRFVNGQLFRSDGQRAKIVLNGIADFGFRQALDGEMINVNFSVGVAPEYDVPSSVLCFTGRFRRAEES